jgi:hypothetical protein
LVDGEAFAVGGGGDVFFGGLGFLVGVFGLGGGEDFEIGEAELGGGAEWVSMAVLWRESGWY